MDPQPQPDPTPVPPAPVPPEMDGKTFARRTLAWFYTQFTGGWGDVIAKAVIGLICAWLAAQQAKVSQTCDAAKAEATAVKAAHDETAAQVQKQAREIKRLEARPPVVKWGE